MNAAVASCRRTVAAAFTLLLVAAPSHAFPYIVRQGDSLARIAQRMYGDPHLESVLATANALDRMGGMPLTPGMRLDVPADMSFKAQRGDTWATLAERWLGAESHAAELASANQGVPWVPPEAGQTVRVFAVLTHIAGPRDFVSAVAKRYGMDPKTSWKLATYNQHSGDDLAPGELIYIPLAHLSLSDEARALLAETSEAGMRAAAADIATRPQPEEAHELLRRLRAGEWAGAIELAQRFARVPGAGGASARALGYRTLLEAYASSGELARARGACSGWKQNAKVDPSATWLSPQLRALCAEPTK